MDRVRLNYKGVVMKDKMICKPNDRTKDFHKEDKFKISRNKVGVIKFVTFNKSLNETQLRVVAK